MRWRMQWPKCGTGAKLLEVRSAQQRTLMGECVECGGMDGEETLDCGKRWRLNDIGLIR